MRVDLQKHSHVVTILLSVLIGMTLMAVLLYYPQERSAFAQPAGNLNAGDWRTALSNVADYCLPAVVSIQGTTKVQPRQTPEDLFPGFPFPWGPGPGGQAPRPAPRERPFLGSGWIYSEDGYIVTNAHVVKDASSLKVQLHDVEDEEPIPATVIGYDARSDLAVIKVEVKRKLPFLTLGSSKNARVGEWVVAVGSPFSKDLQQTVTKGIISAKGRVLEGAATELGAIGASIYDVIQTDASINPGNSGGPLVNLQGQVIGINESIVSPSGGNAGIGFAISSDMAAKVIPQLISKKQVVRGWLGIAIGALDENMRDYYKAPSGGAIVSEINPGGPASQSDLKVEDVIVKVGKTPVHSPSDLQRAVAETEPGTVLVFTVIRGGQQKEVSIKIGEMPENPSFGGPEPQPEQPTAADPLGIQVQTLALSMPQARQTGVRQGVIVTQVDPEGPAAGKLSENDIITKINATDIAGTGDYKTALEAARQAKAKYIILRIVRQEEDQTIKAFVSLEPKW